MFLGVDESNHGKLPEIFVGCYSKDSSKIIKGDFGKPRNERDPFPKATYQHIVFDTKEDRIVGRTNFQVIAACELVRRVNRIRRLEKLFIDGKIMKRTLCKLEKMMNHFLPRTELIFGKGLDKKIPLVNTADRMAYLLYLYYSATSKTPKNQYLNTIVTPRLEDYFKFIDT